jgi:hypothetical protein
MPDLNYLAIVVAAVAVFVFAAIYYGVLTAQPADGTPSGAAAPRPSAGVIALELARALVVASAVAGLVALIPITDLLGALVLGLALWIAFPVVLLIGSVVHERVQVRTAALHAGDWLAKLLVIAVVVSVWR